MLFRSEIKLPKKETIKSITNSKSENSSDSERSVKLKKQETFPEIDEDEMRKKEELESKEESIKEKKKVATATMTYVSLTNVWNIIKGI